MNGGFRVGQGYDVHRLVEGRALILGGIQLEHPCGLLGHSDADVLLHAITDALLGAAGLGDIGQHFPDTDEQFRGASSRVLLKEAYARVRAQGWVVVNIDASIIAQAPRLAPYIEPMIRSIATDLALAPAAVNVKAKTNEKLGYLGRAEAIEAQAICLLQSG